MSEIENGVVTWTGTGGDAYVAKSAEELLRLDTMSTRYVTWNSNFIDLLNVRSLYLTSDSLGNFETLGPRGNRNIIKKILVSSNYGYLILDNIVSTLDGIDVSKAGIKSLHFKLCDARGNVVPLHGSHISFSLIFKTDGF